jgi:hypothetical protein
MLLVKVWLTPGNGEITINGKIVVVTIFYFLQETFSLVERLM